MVCRRCLVPLMIVVAVVGVGCGGGDRAAEEAPDPVAQVQVAVVRADTLVESLTAYGTVIPAPGAVQSFSVPFDCVVRQVLVSASQRVEQGGPLVQVSPSPDVMQAADEARAALAAQQVVTDDTAQRFALGLATKDDQAREEQALADAKASVQKFEAWLGQGTLIAPAAGLVGEVLVGEGTRVPAAGPLVTIALQHRIEVRLGIEPEDVGRLQVSQPVALTPVDRSGGTALMGRIRSIGQQVSPETRLVEVLVALPAEAQGLLLNQFVRGDIELRGRLGLIVPRAALLPREDRFALFTVRGGRAVRRQVDLEAAAGSLVQVRGEGLGVGDSVVVLGNYELGDSMRVQVAPPTGAGNR